jgi:DNA-binding transcriptional ArsR family regulator
MEEKLRARVTVLFSALANETRIALIQALDPSPKTVGQLAKELGIQDSSASQHLAILARAGVLTVTRQGAFRYYSIRGPRIPKILEIIEDFCHVHRIYGNEDLLAPTDS